MGEGKGVTELECVDYFWGDAGGEGLAGEFGGECHDGGYGALERRQRGRTNEIGVERGKGDAFILSLLEVRWVNNAGRIIAELGGFSSRPIEFLNSRLAWWGVVTLRMRLGCAPIIQPGDSNVRKR